MRFTDIFLALPGPVLAITIVAALGPSLWHTLIAVMIVWWPLYSRIVRGEVQRAREPTTHGSRAPRGRRAVCGSCSAISCPGAVPSTLVTASLDVGELVITLVEPLLPRPRRARAGAGARGDERPRASRTCSSTGGSPVIPALAVFAVAVVANIAGDGARDLIGDR